MSALKIKIKLNVAYNETDNISSQAILRRNNILNRYLPALLYLPSTTPFNGSVSKGAASTIFYTFGMVRRQDSNPRPPAPKADTLATAAVKNRPYGITERKYQYGRKNF